MKTGISIPRWSGHPSGVCIDAQLRTVKVAPKLKQIHHADQILNEIPIFFKY